MMKHLNDICHINTSVEMMAWNSFILILLTIASLMVMVNKFNVDSKNNNLIDKVLYGGLSLTALGGVLYPVELGLLGVNIMVTAILVVEFFRYDKGSKKNKW